MKKGVILEIRSQYLVMLTPDGEFVKGKKNSNKYNIGEEIFFYPYKESKLKPTKLTLWSFSSGLVAVFLFCFILLNPSEKDSAYAYVTMDMNPSIEFVLDKNFQVIDTNAYNQTGEKVLSAVKINKHDSFSNAAQAVMNVSQSMGLLEQQENIVIASIIKNEDQKKARRLEQEVEKIHTSAKRFETNIEIVKGSLKERTTARKKGISTGKYLVEKKREKEPKPDLLNQTSNKIENRDVINKNNNKKQKKIPQKSNNNKKQKKVPQVGNTNKKANGLVTDELLKEKRVKSKKKEKTYRKETKNNSHENQARLKQKQKREKLIQNRNKNKLYKDKNNYQKKKDLDKMPNNQKRKNDHEERKYNHHNPKDDNKWNK